jgi:hypothetical protein
MSKSFTGAIRGLINQEIEAIHTALPAKVVRVDGMNIDAEPLVNLFKNGTHRILPTIYSVPFMPPRMKKCGIQWNPEVGDKVMLLVMELSIDNLMVGSGSSVVNSEDGRRFDLSDAVAISGFLNDSENKPIPSTDGIKVFYEDQSITIKKNGDIVIGGGAVTQALLTEAFKLAMEAHTHPIIPPVAPSTVPTITGLPTILPETVLPYTTNKTKAE